MSDLGTETKSPEQQLDLDAAPEGKALAPTAGAGQAVAAPAAEGSMMNFIAAAVNDPRIDVAKLDALLRMQREIKADDAKAQFNRDFIALALELPRITKDGDLEYPIDKRNPEGPKRKISTYAKWERIDAEIRPILHSHGFALGFTTEKREGGGLVVIAILRHRDGHQTETPFPVPLDTSGGKNDLQGYGSSLSYGKRYAATAALNIITVGEDDDGVRGGTRYLTTGQAAEIKKLLQETNSDVARFLQHYGVPDVESFEERDFVRVKNALLQKKSKVKA
jgi:hypothetical protein